MRRQLTMPNTRQFDESGIRIRDTPIIQHDGQDRLRINGDTHKETRINGDGCWGGFQSVDKLWKNIEFLRKNIKYPRKILWKTYRGHA